MTELQPLSCGHREKLNEIFKSENSRSADYCFGNFFMWDNRFRQYVCTIENRLVTRLTRNGEVYFAFPVGSGDISPALTYMKSCCLEMDIPLKICGICDEHLPLLGDEFKIFPDRDFSDYIYKIEALSSFSGKHLHGKKNFCNRFEKEHQWHFEPMSAENLPLCREMLCQWLEKEAMRLSGSIVYEGEALRIAFNNFEELGLEGGVLFADGYVVGFSLGEVISDDTFCVHFEKAFSDIPGAYPMVCRETAKMIRDKYPEICYVNREDDMGIEALRKSKLSYKPEYILEKHTAIWNENE
ncbi:MAG: phosphatidylglycerol lysyltransferase domain-containing protein [Bacillota bacterium]|nr:phosphatidylglycerol lysyltransferase domain-containing protein [Bacillota bacterium]